MLGEQHGMSCCIKIYLHGECSQCGNDFWPLLGCWQTQQSPGIVPGALVMGAFSDLLFNKLQLISHSVRLAKPALWQLMVRELTL